MLNEVQFHSGYWPPPEGMFHAKPNLQSKLEFIYANAKTDEKHELIT